MITIMNIYYLSFPQKFLVNNMIIGNISSLPTIISAERYNFNAGLKHEKSPTEVVSPNPIPVLESIASAADAVELISKPCSDRTTVENRKTNIYVKMNTVIAETTGAGNGIPPILTATIERGCNLLIPPRSITLNITSTLITLMEPDVDAAHPPMNIRMMSTTWHTDGHMQYSAPT